MKGRICLCPASIKWIVSHLKKSAKAQFRIMVKDNFEGTFIKLKGKRKRKFSQKQLRAQRLFAKRARAGTLRRRR